MWIVLGVVLGWLILFLEILLSGWLPFNISLVLVMGIVLYFAFGKKIGLAMLLSWAIWQDILFNPWLPVSVGAVVLSWWLWQKFINIHLTPGAYVTILGSAVAWYVLYNAIHWLISWLPYLLGDSILYPGVSTRWPLLAWSWLVSLLVLALLIVIFMKRIKENHD